MRKLIWMMSVSIDGYMSGLHGELDWHRVDEELHRYLNEHLATMGMFLSGRVTHEMMADYWPTADADPSATETEAEFARIWREMPKLVFSRTLHEADWNARVARDVVPADINELKQQSGGDLLLGGAELGATFVQLDLIDEYRLYVHPVIVGWGIPMLRPSDAHLAVQLAETRQFGNGVVMLRYDRAAARSAETEEAR